MSQNNCGPPEQTPEELMRFLQAQNARYQQRLTDHADLVARERGSPRPWIDELQQMQNTSARRLAEHRTFMSERPAPPPGPLVAEMYDFSPPRPPRAPRPPPTPPFDPTVMQRRSDRVCETAMREILPREVDALTSRAQANLERHRQFMRDNPMPPTPTDRVQEMSARIQRNLDAHRRLMAGPRHPRVENLIDLSSCEGNSRRGRRGW